MTPESERLEQRSLFEPGTNRVAIKVLKHRANTIYVLPIKSNHIDATP